MTAARRWLAALGSLAVTLAVVAGVPVGLWLAAGWTAPDHLPSVGQVSDALTHPWNPDTRTLIRILSVPCWLLWADLVLALGVEVRASLGGRPGPRVTLPVLQRWAGRLVTAMFFAWVAASSLRPPVSPTLAHATAASVSASTAAVLTRAQAPSPSPSAAVPAETPASPAATRSYAVRHGDTLWGIAARELGDGTRWRDIWRLNADTEVAPGQTLTSPEEIDGGMTLLLPAGAAADAAAPARTHEVLPGETLSGISEAELGDGSRYPELVQLNEGRTEPDGRLFGDPHWIYPGWQIVLPGAPLVSPPPAAPFAAPAPAPSTTPAPPPPARSSRAPAADDGPPAWSGTATPVTAVPTGRPEASPAAGPDGGEHGRGAAAPVPPAAAAGSPLVEVPGVGIVAVAFAAGVAGAVSLARRQAWRRWRPGDRGAALRAVEALRTAEVRALERVDRRSQLAILEDEPGSADAAGDPAGETAPEVDGPAPEPAPVPATVRTGWLVAGEVDGREMAIDIGSLSGTGFVGEGAEPALRALALAFLVHAGVNDARALLTGPPVSALLPEMAGVPGVEVLGGLDDVLRRLEREAGERERILGEHDVDDFDGLAATVPWEAAVAVLAVTATGDPAEVERVRALVERGRRLGIALVWVGPSPVGPTLHVGAGGEVSGAGATQGGAVHVERLPLLDTAAAARVVAVIAAARGAEPPPATARPSTPVPAAPVTAAAPDDEETALLIDGDDVGPVSGEVVPRVHVSVLGGMTVRDAGGHEIRPRGRPRPALELVAFLACNEVSSVRPEHGATLEQALCALHPDSARDLARNAFKQAVLAVRDALAQGGRGGHLVHRRTDGVYLFDPELVSVDLWEFEAADRALRAATDRYARVRALERMVHAYRGPLLEGQDAWEWAPQIEERRERLRGRAAEALHELAALRHDAGDTDGALAAAERALVVAPDAEELYQLAMRLQAEASACTRIRSTLRLLEVRYSELGVDVSEETYELAKDLLRGAARERR